MMSHDLIWFKSDQWFIHIWYIVDPVSALSLDLKKKKQHVHTVSYLLNDISWFIRIVSLCLQNGVPRSIHCLIRSVRIKLTFWSNEWSLMNISRYLFTYVYIIKYAHKLCTTMHHTYPIIYIYISPLWLVPNPYASGNQTWLAWKSIINRYL